MRADLLDVVTVRSNPLRYKAPDRIAKDWIQHMLDSGVAADGGGSCLRRASV
jgi:hypothetical protein